MSNNTETLKTEISRQCRRHDGSMALPGSIVGGFTYAQLRLAVSKGWVKRVGDQVVLTKVGYSEL